MKKKPKKIPTFRSEDDGREYWSKHSTLEHFNPSEFIVVHHPFSHLKRSIKPRPLMNTPLLVYKDYSGFVTVDTHAKTLWGEVIGLRDVITFQGKTVAQVEQAFRESVDDYLAYCKKLRRKPERPNKIDASGRSADHQGSAFRAVRVLNFKGHPAAVLSGRLRPSQRMLYGRRIGNLIILIDAIRGKHSRNAVGSMLGLKRDIQSPHRKRKIR